MRGIGAWAVRILAVFLLLIGLALSTGGAWLIVLGGSWYYLIAGAGLAATAMLLLRGRALGVWIYVGVFAGTLAWAVWEVGLNGWALAPRLIGPTLLLFLIIACLPVLDSTRGRRRAFAGGGAWLLLVLIGAGAVAMANRAPGAGPMPALLGPMSDPSTLTADADWPAYSATHAARRYSSLTQITRDNVGALERAWVYRTGDLPGERFGAETTPIKIGDTLYLCSGRNIIIALNAATGTEIWRHDPQVSDENIPYTAACRGVAYYAAPQGNVADGCQERIIEGTLDGRLIAVNARTGQRCADFGEGGEVSITDGMGEVVPGMVSITSVPTIVRGTIVTGHQVLDGQTLDAPSGVIQAYDALTGELRWAWDVNRRPIGTPYRRAKGTPFALRGSVDAGRGFRAAGGVGRA